MKYCALILICMMCISGRSQAKGIPPPPPSDELSDEDVWMMMFPASTTSEVTAPATGCATEDGVVPVGAIVQMNLCVQCICIEDNLLKCNTTICPKLNCVDSIPVENQCCSICPNGENCYTPQHVILKAEHTITESGLQCKCRFIEDDPEEPMAQCSFG
ncbi:von Willebrand factor C domain-containing protein 2-like [Argonauta hians]